MALGGGTVVSAFGKASPRDGRRGAGGAEAAAGAAVRRLGPGGRSGELSALTALPRRRGRPGRSRQAPGERVRRRPTGAVYGRGADRRPTALRALAERRHERRRRAVHAMGRDRSGLEGGASLPENPPAGDPIRARHVATDTGRRAHRGGRRLAQSDARWDDAVSTP